MENNFIAVTVVAGIVSRLGNYHSGFSTLYGTEYGSFMPALLGWTLVCRSGRAELNSTVYYREKNPREGLSAGKMSEHCKRLHRR
ncbi:MAG: hypothetical protein IPM85_15045 [Chitinophagaceae bacterium]|nr:hypothetical protein [Chitinophagaceae bacterium]